MKTNLIQSFGALALIGLSVSLTPTNTFASEFARGERHPSHHDSRCSNLPHGARCISRGSERCWVSNGCYYRPHPLGGYVICERPTYCQEVVVKRPVIRKEIVVEQQYVEQPVVEEQYVEQPVGEETQYVEAQSYLEEEETVVETLPARCRVVVIEGERCWERDGVYYRHCEGGYRRCHPCKRGHGDYPKGDHWPKGDHHSQGDNWPQHNDNDHKPNHKPDQTGNGGMGQHKPGKGGHNNGGMGGMGQHNPHQTGNGGSGMGQHKPHQTGGMGGHMNHGGHGQGGKNGKHNN
jgi:hypothetical protein